MVSSKLESQKQQFQYNITKWFTTTGRKFPWRSSSNPYSILIAELMLRRTTAVAVNRVYHLFMNRFRNPHQLAHARRSTIEKMIASLGLQRTRSRHLKKLGVALVDEYDGSVPNTLDELIHLPGVGRYVASAVLNFAYLKPVPLVDGNVLHILSRVFGKKFDGPTDEKAWDFMSSFQYDNDCRSFYWGIIDLVALVCLRRNPRCNECPLTEICTWYLNQSL